MTSVPAMVEFDPAQKSCDGVTRVVKDLNLAMPKGEFLTMLGPSGITMADFFDIATDTQRLADQAKWIGYGPGRKSTGVLVGMYQDGKTGMGPFMPTSVANLKNALASSDEFWVDRDGEMNERFNARLAG